MENLKEVEERLLKERDECERLEAQIRELAGGDSDLLSPAKAKPKVIQTQVNVPIIKTQPVIVTTRDSYEEDEDDYDEDNESYEGSLYDDESVRSGNRRGLAPAIPSSRHPKGQPDSFSRSAHSVRSRSPHKGEFAMTSAAGVSYLSPMYRPASPRRRVAKGGNVMSSFSRAARFVDTKRDIPGPGTYYIPDIFHPQILGPTVNITSDMKKQDPALGYHTHHDVAVASGKRASQIEEHHAAMLSATARAKNLVPNASIIRNTNSIVENDDGELKENDIYTIVNTLVTAADGDERQALIDSVKRERQLRKEIVNLTKQSNSHRLQLSQVQATSRIEIDALIKRLDKKDGGLEENKARAKLIRDLYLNLEDSFSALQQTINELGSSLAAAELDNNNNQNGNRTPGRNYTIEQLEAGLHRANSKIPSLPRLVEAAKGLDASIEQLGHAVIDAAKSASIHMPSGAANGGDNGSGYLAYSSLSTPTVSVGTLGKSATVITGRSAPASPGSPTSNNHNNDTASQVAAFASKTRLVSDALQKEAEAASALSVAQRKGYDVSNLAAKAENAVAAARAAAGLDRGRSPNATSWTNNNNNNNSSGSPRRSSQSPTSNLSAAINAARGRSGSVVSRSTTMDASPRSSAVGSSSTMNMDNHSPTSFMRHTASSAGASIKKANSTVTAGTSAKETTVADTLSQLFRYYSLYGVRDSDGTGLTSQQLFRLVREAGILDNRVTHADVDLAFTRAAAQGRAPGQGTKAGAGSRISFEGFIAAINDLAVKRYRGPDAANAALSKAAGASQSADPDAFRQLLQECILPVYAKLKNGAAMNADFSGDSAAATAAAFADEFLRPEVLSFFSDYKPALQGMFAQYAMQDRTGKGFTISKTSLLKFAGDYKIIPNMMTRPEFVTVLKDASRAIGRDDNAEELTYPEFIELLGMLAFTLGEQAAAEGGRPGYSALGLQPGVAAPMRSKLELLFFNMRENGAKFTGELGRMIHAVAKAVEASAAANKSSARTQQPSVSANILGERIVA